MEVSSCSVTDFYSVCKNLSPIQKPSALFIFITVIHFELIKFYKLDLPNPDIFWQIPISEKMAYNIMSMGQWSMVTLNRPFVDLQRKWK